MQWSIVKKKNKSLSQELSSVESLSCTSISLATPPPPSPSLDNLASSSVCLSRLSLDLSLSSPTPARCHSSGTHSLSPLKLDPLLSFIRFKKGQGKKGLCPIQARTAAFTNRSQAVLTESRRHRQDGRASTDPSEKQANFFLKILALCRENLQLWR